MEIEDMHWIILFPTLETDMYRKTTESTYSTNYMTDCRTKGVFSSKIFLSFVPLHLLSIPLEIGLWFSIVLLVILVSFSSLEFF